MWEKVPGKKTAYARAILFQQEIVATSPRCAVRLLEHNATQLTTHNSLEVLESLWELFLQSFFHKMSVADAVASNIQLHKRSVGQSACQRAEYIRAEVVVAQAAKKKK